MSNVTKRSPFSSEPRHPATHRTQELNALDLSDKHGKVSSGDLDAMSSRYYGATRQGKKSETAHESMLHALDLASPPRLKPPVSDNRSIRAKDVEQLKRVRVALQTVPCVVIVVPSNAMGCGHQTACASAYSQLRKIYEGPIVVRYDRFMAPGLEKVFPGFKTPAKREDVVTLITKDGQRTTFVTAYSKRETLPLSAGELHHENSYSVPAGSIAIYPALDLKPLDEYNTTFADRDSTPDAFDLNMLGVEKALILQPFAWGPSEWSSPEGIVRIDNIGGQGERAEFTKLDLPDYAAYYPTELTDEQSIKASSPELESIFRRVKNGTCDLMPIYYGNHYSHMVSLQKIVDTLDGGIHIDNQKNGGPKPTLMLLMNDPRDRSQVATALGNRFLSLKDPELESKLNALVRSDNPPTTIMIHVGPLPQAAFNRCFAWATRPAAIEGANTADYCLKLRLPFFSVRSDNAGKYIYPSELSNEKGGSLKYRKFERERTVYERGKHQAMRVSSYFDARPEVAAKAMADFQRAVREPNSLESNYFDELSQRVNSSEGDQLVRGLDLLLTRPPASHS